jgi:hypothetical protein
MEPNKEQPKADVRRSVAALAKVNRLYPFDDLSLIDKYARRFGLDPDWVYHNTAFGTITGFHVMWKEQEEYQERFEHIYREVNTAPTAGKAASK